MSGIEKLTAMSSYEVRLVLRSRSRLAMALIPPVLGGMFIGLVSRLMTPYLTPYGSFLILPLSALFLAAEPGITTSLHSQLPACLLPGRLAMTLAWLLPIIFIAAVQALLYLGTLLLLDVSSIPPVRYPAASLLLAVLSAYGIRSLNRRGRQ